MNIRRTTRSVSCAALLAGALCGQADKITEARVREVVTWLASDERAGRGTGSVELDEAARWIAARFEAAGLAQVRDGAWAHEFSMEGVRLDSDQVELTLQRQVPDEPDQTFELVAGEQVRQWLPADGVSGEETCTVAPVEDPVLQRLLTARSARRPIVIEVDEQHAYWRKAAGAHAVIARPRGAARPVLLVKAGLLPAAPTDGREVVWTARWKVAPPEKADVTQQNVLAMLKAREDSPSANEYVVVSAHYDHLGAGPARGADGIYNGADDNATGTTAVVLLAEAMAHLKGAAAPQRNVLFVAFAAEERGLRGSKAFCERPPVPIERVVANLNIEMIGRPQDGRQGKAWITGASYSDFAEICAGALGKTGVELVEFPMAMRLFEASDNFSFVQHGVVAHSISAGSLHHDYHQPSDEVDKLDTAHMTRIVRALYDVTLELANRTAPPKWSEEGGQMLGRVRRKGG